MGAHSAAALDTSPREIKALTGLRAFAAFWVLLFHLKNGLIATFPDFAPLLRLVVGTGYLGVDLFFVLSGFIISYTYAERFRAFDLAQYGRFLWARLARIYPVHLVTLIAVVIFISVVKVLPDMPLPQPERYTLGRLLENLLLLHGWAFPIEKSWNVPAWSISVEWLAYLLFPLVTLAVATVRQPILILTVILALFGLQAMIYGATDHRGTVSYGLARLAVEFPAGCLLYQLYRQGCWSKAVWGAIVIGISLCAALLLLLDMQGILRGAGGELALFVVPPAALAAMVYGLACEERAPISRWLSRPTMLFWGRASYSLYMVHFVLIMMLTWFLPWAELATQDFWTRFTVLAALVVAILGASAATYRFIEVPSRRWMRRLAPDPEPAPVLGRG